MSSSICNKQQIDPLGDHLYTCTVQSVPKAHDWVVDQLPDLFHTTHKTKTRQVVRRRGQPCGDIELSDYLTKVTDPNYMDRSLNESVTDKIRKYLSDYNNNPPNSISFISPITSTSGRIHSEFVRLLFLQERQHPRISKSADLHITLYIDVTPLPLIPTYTPLVFRCPSPPLSPVYVSRVDPSALAFSLSLL